MRVLYQFPLSHFCEKARWLLDYKELPFVAQNLTPGLHRFKIRRNTQQHQLPVLYDRGQWIADSTRIALYLDQYYPEHSLLCRDETLRQKILRLDDKSQQLGFHVRRWLFSLMLQQPFSTSMDVMLGEQGILRRLEKFSVPALKLAIKRYHHIDEQSSRQSKQMIEQLVTELNAALGCADYLVGQQLTLADIAVCSMLAPILMIENTPWEKHQQEVLAEELLEYKFYLSDLPLGQYVQRIYQQERRARVDWRGMP